jgi:hypothetical protein
MSARRLFLRLLGLAPVALAAPALPAPHDPIAGLSPSEKNDIARGIMAGGA